MALDITPIMNAAKQQDEDMSSQDLETVVDDVQDAPVDDDNDNAASSQDESPVVDTSSNADRERFESCLPALKGSYDALSPEMRTRMLLNMIEGNNTVATQNNTGEGDSVPKIREIQPLDMNVATERLVRAIESGDADDITSAQKAISQHQEQLLGVLYDYSQLNAYETNQLKKELSEIRRPVEIRKIGASVPGFEDSDVDKALQLVDSGQISNMSLAVKFAVQERLLASKRTVPPTAAEMAARQAAGAMAASAPGSQSGSRSNVMTPVTNFDSPQGRALLQSSFGIKKK
jgi:hypothetical protein